MGFRLYADQGTKVDLIMQSMDEKLTILAALTAFPSPGLSRALHLLLAPARILATSNQNHRHVLGVGMYDGSLVQGPRMPLL